MTQHYLALSLLSASLLGLTACGGSDGTNTPPPATNQTPTAIISSDSIINGENTINVTVGDELKFDAESSIDNDGSITAYLWHGTALSEKISNNSCYVNFQAEGQYQLTLTVTDNEGEEGEATVNFIVSPRQDNKQLPVANISPNPVADQLVNTSMTFDASGSFDNDGTIEKYSWSNGDTGPTATYTFTTLGKNSVAVTVTDNDNLINTATINVNVINKPSTNHAPSAKITVPTDPVVTTVQLNESITFSGAESSDPDGDKLTYLWSTEETSEQITYTFSEAGTQTISLTVNDGELSSTPESVSIIVLVPCCNELPEAIISPATAQQIDVNETLILSAGNSTGNELQYLWSTGETAESISVSYATAGNYLVELTVTDVEGETATQSVAITVNEPHPSNTFVYYKSSSAASIHAWDKTTEENYTSGWPGDPMDSAPELGDNWYKFDFGKTIQTAGVIFDGVPDSDLDFNAATPCYENNSWSNNCLSLLDPDFDETAPTITATPAAGYYSDKTTLNVTLKIEDNKDPAPVAYYTLDGSTPTTASTPYSGSITIDDTQLKGVDGVITLLAVDKKGNSATKTLSYYLNEAQQGKPDPMQLGAVYSSDATTFRIWSPDSGNVKVRVDGNEHTLAKVSDFDGYSDIYEVVVDGDLHLTPYTFLINGAEVRDPYGKMAKPQSQTNVVMNMALTDLPGGWSPRPELTEREDAIIYEVHVRDFTIDDTSGVPAEKRGRYLGMVEAGTTYQNVKTGIDHLKELGVTHIQLMPVYDYGTCDGQKDCFNWGYDPRNYNVPEDGYSQYAGDEYVERVKEFKMMVDEFHKAGFRVIMDVVYNHSYATEMFDGISGSYYHSFGDMSGCSNSIASEVPMVSRMIQDSLDYWVGEYNIDGFRFDLIGIFLASEVEKWGRHLNTKYADRNLLLYGEPWDGYFWPQRDKDPLYSERLRPHQVYNLVEEHVGVFNGIYRDAIKGENDKPKCAWMCNNMAFDKVAGGWGIYDGIMGSPRSSNNDPERKFTKDPEQSINYISAHDNYGLWDKVYLATADDVAQVGNGNHQLTRLTPPSDLNRAKKVVNFGMGIVFTSQGIPFVHAGDEFLRTKTNNGDMANVSAWNDGSNGGTHNTYNLPDSWNKIRWNWKAENAGTFKYFKDLIEIRKNHAGLRMNTAQEIADYLHMDTAIVNSSDGHLITAHSTYPKDSHELFIVLNNESNGAQISLPAGSWTQIADSSGAVNVGGLSGSVSAEGTAVTIYRKE